ncbi:hypothetical protein E0Z10_g637 [Xylaria hypoxylon]|uniref:DUF6594 domain-containing protein n=1 Tax=Xylaria hypoxylon TaxID=37992 RepID=A0A4Z0Z8E4_9PEZI|nr:hypothetical protein E0Z10_g637 [Xylaria hypoxylon]
MEDPSAEEVQKKPWKYVGYKRYTEFISTDPDLLIFRRFGTLNARVGLVLQDRISLLEQKLIDLDNEYSRRNADPINNGTLRDDIQDREALLNTISYHLDKYNKFLIQQSQLREYVRAPSRDIKSLRTWHDNHQNMAIDEEEHKYLEQHQDLICLQSNEKTPLRNWIDNSLTLRTLSIWKKQTRNVPTYEANNISYYSNTSMDSFASAMIVLVGAFLLVTPLWILQAIENLQTKLAVITTFVLVFLLILSFAMVSKPFEALGATAAYAAVLMVFIQVSL